MLTIRVLRRMLLVVPLCAASLALTSPRSDASPALPHPGESSRGRAPATLSTPPPWAGVAASELAAAPGLVVTPLSVHADLYAGDEVTRTLELRNPGAAALTYRLLARAASFAAPATLPPGLAVGHVLLVEEQLPSGSTADQDLLLAAGATVDRIAAASFAVTDLAPYSLIVIASDQSTSFYVTLNQQGSRLESWVAAGGVLQAQVAAWFESGDASQLRLPGGVSAQPGVSGINHVTAPSHPIMAGIGTHSAPGAGRTLKGSFASRGHLTGLPAEAEILTEDPQGAATLAVYRVGAGSVIAGVQPYEYGVETGQATGQILRNMIAFALSGGGARWLRFEPIAGTVEPGGSATVTLHLPSEGLAAGDYAQDLELSSTAQDLPSLTVPVTMHVADAPHLVVSGRPVVQDSRQVYFTSGVTRHRFVVGPVSPSRIDFDLDLLGNFGNPGNFATLAVEGVTLGRAGETDDNNTCGIAGASFSLAGAALAAVLADGIVDVEVRNSPRVNPNMCYAHEHLVQMRFREPGDPVVFGDRFLGACTARELALRNTGTLPLAVTGFAMSLAAYTDASVPVTLPPGGETPAAITFCPQAAGPSAGTWSVLSDDPRGARLDVTLRGTGLVPPEIAAAPGLLVVDLFPGERSVRSLGIANLGGSDLEASLRLTADATLPKDAAGAARHGGGTPHAGAAVPHSLARDDPADAPATSPAEASESHAAARKRAFSAQPPTTVLADDFEGGSGGWTSYVTSGHLDQWSRSTARANSGSTSWNARNEYNPGSSALQSPDVDLTAFRHVQLAFKHFYRFGCANSPEFAPYGGIVEAQVAGEPGWVQLTPVGGYPSAVEATENIGEPCPQPLEGLPAYAHDGDDAGAFLGATFDLSEFAGHVMRFRLHAGWGCEERHDCGRPEGWYVDDVVVTADAPRWLELAPTSMTVRAGARQEAALAFDTGLIGPGDWTAVVDVSSNDPRTPVLSVPVTLHVADVAGALTLDHRTLEAGEGGPWLKATLTLPEGRWLEDVNVSSVTLNGVPVERAHVAGDAGEAASELGGPGRSRAHQPKMTLRFDRDAVLATFGDTSPQALALSGLFADGERFLARDSVALGRRSAAGSSALAQGAPPPDDGAPGRGSLADARFAPAFGLVPNPVRRGSALHLALSLPRAGRVEAAVYSPAGRLVRTLASGACPAGPVSLEWDGLDGGERAVEPGVYLVRVQAPGFSATRRAVMLR